MSLITPLLEKTPASNQNAIIPATHSLDSLIKNLPSLALPDFTVQGSFTKIRTIGNNINLISAQSILIFNLDTKTESSLDFQTDSTVKFSPNKKFLLTFSNSYGSKKIWDVDKKQELGLITTKYNINSYVFSSDSRYLLISTYEIFMYDLIGKQHVKTFGPQEDENKPFIKNLRLIEDDQTVVTFSDELIKLWNLDSGLCIRAIPSPEISILKVVGRISFVTACVDGTIRFHDLHNQRGNSVLQAHQASVIAIKINKTQQNIKIWNFQTSREISSFKTATNIKELRFANNENYVVKNSNSSISAYDIESSREVLEISDKNNEISSWNFTKNKEFIIVSFKHGITKIWKLAYKPLLKCIRDSDTHIQAGNKLINFGSKDINIRDTLTLSILFKFERESPIQNQCAVCTQDGRYLIAGDAERFLYKWDLIENNQVFCNKTLVNEKKRGNWSITYNIIKLSYDQKSIFSVSNNGEIHIFSSETGELTCKFQINPVEAKSLVISQDDKSIFVLQAGDIIRKFSIESKTQQAESTAEKNISSISILHSSDLGLEASYVLGIVENVIKVWSADDLQVVFVLDGHLDKILSSVIHNKNLYTSSADKTVKMWELIYFREVATYRGPSSAIDRTLVIEDKYLVGACQDGIYHVWDITERNILGVFQSYGQECSFLGFDIDRNNLIACRWDSSICLFDFSGITASNNSISVNGFADQFYVQQYLSHFSEESTASDPELSKGVIMPLGINLLHYYCYYDMVDHLKLALSINTPFFKDRTGRSPFSYAILTNSHRCMDEILRYISEIEDKDLLSDVIYAIRDDIPDVLRINSSRLLPFLEKIYERGGKESIFFANPKSDLPINKFSSVKRLYFQDFVIEEETDQKQLLVQHWASPLSWNYTNGSSHSLWLLKSILECDDLTIYQAPFIETLVILKWMSIKPYVLAQSLIFWSNIVFMMLAMFYDSLVFNCIFMLINLLITVIELTQLFSDFRIYFADPWNYLDQLRLILCFTVGILDLMDKNDINLTFVLVLINFTRGLTYFRAFDMTRFYVRLIIIAIKDSVSFLVIFLYSTLAFGVIYAATYGDSDLISVWKQSYELNMGNFSNDDYSILQYTCFTLATLINVVVMLNLLISILGDSFEKFQNTAKEIDLKEMLNVIIEFETMMFWNFNRGTRTYMQKCDYFSENKFGDVWQGKIKEIANKIEGLKGEFMSKIDGNQQVNSDKLNNIDRFKEEVLNNLRVIRDENTVRIEKLERDIQEMGAMMNERLYMIMLNLTPPSNPGNFEPYGMPIAIEPQGIHQIIERPDY